MIKRNEEEGTIYGIGNLCLRYLDLLDFTDTFKFTLYSACTQFLFASCKILAICYLLITVLARVLYALKWNMPHTREGAFKLDLHI